MKSRVKAAGAGKVACRLCKGDHFTAKCPYKDTLGGLENTGTFYIATFIEPFSFLSQIPERDQMTILEQGQKHPHLPLQREGNTSLLRCVVLLVLVVQESQCVELGIATTFRRCVLQIFPKKLKKTI
jgi:hypothetical protein